MSCTSINGTFLLILLLSLKYSAYEIGAERHSHSVKIFSRILDSKPITVHCQSKDDDLGNRTLYTGQDFNWEFKNNFWGTTLFFCRFGWGDKTKAFDVFKAGWDGDYGDGYHHTYTYEVNNQGFYLGYDEQPSDQMHQVNNWE